MKKELFAFFLWFIPAILLGQISIMEVGHLPEAVSNNAVCEGFIDDQSYVYSFGGIDSTKIYSGIHNRSFRYHVQSGEVIQIPSLPDPRGKIAAAASRIGNIIYIAGGYHVFQNGSELSSNKMHRYDITTNTYLADGADIPIATDDHIQAIWRDSLIYLITGWSNTGNIPNVQIYNPTSDVWTRGTNTPNNNAYKSFGASGLIVQDTIYYFGGASSGAGFGIQNQLRKGVINPTDPAEIEWSISTPDPNVNGYRMASVFKGDKLYWIGGSQVTYNFDGIAYNGSGPVPNSNRIISTGLAPLKWDEILLDEIPMDLRGIASMTDNTFYLAGGMLSNQTVTNKIFQLTFDPVSISSKSTLDLQIPVYPNPFLNEFRIDQPIDKKYNVEIYNSLGHKILERKLLMGTNSFDLREFQKGIFFIKLHSEGLVQTRTLLRI